VYPQFTMRKYFTWRCIGLHVLALIVVPACFLLGRWQYHAALSGNSLSWAYTFEWPAFGIYAIYMWWQLIHDQRTAFDRLWAAKQRSATEASGRPLQQIPGWALDKSLSKAVTEASLEPAKHSALLHGKRTEALESQEAKSAAARAVAESIGDPHPERRPEGSGGDMAATHDGADEVVDAEVVDVKVQVDEELAAYNRYLADLSWSDPPKRW
jgi:DNA-binding transcriptional regulator of glucitol operon